MGKYQSVAYGRVFVLELETGDDILACATALMEEQKLARAVFLAGAGSVSQCRSHFAGKNEEGKYRDYPLAWEGPHELNGVSGFIEKGRPHLHGVLGNREESWTVHLHEGCICLDSFRLVAAELV